MRSCQALLYIAIAGGILCRDPKLSRAKALKRFWEDGDTRGIRPDWIDQVRRVLDLLDAAARPESLDVPGLGFHELRGDRKGTYSVLVSRNWRITFEWEDGEAVRVDLEDYHGR